MVLRNARLCAFALLLACSQSGPTSNGFRCSTVGSCPGGYQCIEDRCWRGGVLPDGQSPEAIPDAAASFDGWSVEAGFMNGSPDGPVRDGALTFDAPGVDGPAPTPDVSAPGSDVAAPQPDAPAFAPVPDAKPLAPDVVGCPSTCTIGERRCGIAGGVQECSVVNGCPAWTTEVACSGAKTCQPGAAGASCVCPAVCITGDQRCSGGGVQTCTTGASGCPTWDAQISQCPSPTICKQSGSLASCTCSASDCVLGVQQCGSGGGIQTCVMSGACPAWSSESACPSPKSCQLSGASASCSCPVGGCTLGNSMCGPSGGVQTCVMNGACTSWSSESACPSPKMCQQSGSSASCACPSSCTVGAQRCGSTGTAQVCVSGGGCNVWGPEVAGERCSDGSCQVRRWTFESGTTEGFYVDTSRSTVAPALSAKAPPTPGQGSVALSAPISYAAGSTVTLNLRVPLCPGGSNISNKNFHVSWMFDGPTADFATSTAVRVITSNGVKQLAIQSGGDLNGWMVQDLLIFGDPSFTSVTDLLFEFDIRLGSSNWQGTFWLDDVRIE